MLTAAIIVVLSVFGVWLLYRCVPPVDEWDPWPPEDEAVDDFNARLDAYIAERELE